MSWREDIKAEPWRFDMFNVLRRLERCHPDRPRIGQNATLREACVRLGQNPFLAFPASNLDAVRVDDAGTFHVMVRFLGMLGPQGPLPLATTAEALEWSSMREDAFARFLDIFNDRFIALFYRAWADVRPIAQHERPNEDRFADYVGSQIGLGRALFRDLDAVPDAQKLAHAGLMAPAAKSASRLEFVLAGVLGLDAQVEEFVGTRLAVEPADQTRLGTANARLGAEAMAGSSVFSVSDKIRIRIRTPSFPAYERLLPAGDHAEPLADLVLFYLGETVAWDMELALPARAVPPLRLNGRGALGWTCWLSPAAAPPATAERDDAHFNLAERIRARRSSHAAHAAL
ncbi:type VI secretion system baseplate subunit TssG [Aquabacter sp. L1I39]|uniref:type VI secretion system baseplate subunit TssG n=1 Tax=Aquabacter sp. L1I39 TaxID=2820278 RepID=UPI001ADACB6D|nr:type VI secretion system baseplate subunit TssG [Aquabacter sp. L1I39]QTL04418.1 type VI secretion system baseplate subunit TssG [Aquabacter sp. L1I39]